MLKNSNYVCGDGDVFVPANLNFGDFILKKLLEHGHKIAAINASTHEKLTYHRIAQEAVNLAVSLIRIGVQKGDTVALLSENRLEFFSTAIGVVCVGGVLSPVNTGYGENEMQHILKISKPNYIICSELAYKNNKTLLKSLTYLKKIILYGNERHDNSLLYNDLATVSGNGSSWLKKNVDVEKFEPVDVQGQTDTIFVLYSSGTTGLPKGVMLTHLNVITLCSIYNPVFAYDNVEALQLIITPWYHSMGFMGCLASISKGNKIVFLSKFNLKLYLETIERYKITQLTAVPPLLVTLCKSNFQNNVSSVRIIYSGAAPLHKDILSSLQQKFPNLKGVLQGYGMTECTLSVTRDSANVEDAKPGGVGRVTRSVIVKVIDVRTGKALGPNQPGEICVKGPMVMKGYVGKERGDDFDNEGFYKTGDIGYYDDDKYFFIVDRIKELIKYKGFQVPPAEIEAVLFKHETVRDVAVVGVENKDCGEVPLAFVVLQPDKSVKEEDLKNFVAKNLSNPKHLRGGVIFIDSIPKNPSGKILRRQLRNMAAARKSKL